MTPSATSPEQDYRHELRRALLLALGILETGPEAAFDGLTLGAVAATGCPVAALSLADGDRLWFKSRQGAHAEALLQDNALMDEALQAEGWLEVTDLRTDPRWRDQPWDAGEPSLRYYAGVPVRVEGLMVGSLCVADSLPRAPMPATTRETLTGLAAAAEALLLARRPGIEADARALRRRQQLLARISHEMRTPLNAILGFSQLIRMSPVGQAEAPVGDWLGQIESGSRHLLALVEELLEMARFEMGRHRLTRQPLDLLRLALDTAELVTPQAAARHVALSVGEPGTDADRQALADDRAVRQILANLVTNAVQHSRPGGKVTLALGRHDGRCTVAVRDTGPGIATEVLPDLFEAFEHPAPGGLGLAISRQLAEAMHGAVTVDSQVGVGSVFTLHLPAQPAA